MAKDKVKIQGTENKFNFAKPKSAEAKEDGFDANKPKLARTGEDKDGKESKFKRASAKLTRIKDLAPEQSRVSLVGTVVSINPELYSFMIDDGTGTVLVLTNDIEKFSQLKEGQIIRVFGRVWGEVGEIEIQSDLIQDFSKIDLELFRKVYK